VAEKAEADRRAEAQKMNKEVSWNLMFGVQS